MRTLIKSLALIIMLMVTSCYGDFTNFNPEINDGEAKKTVDVVHTPTERQSIGNCWLYAQATWVESMYKRLHNQDIDISQSYWTYMHWFMQIKSKSNIEEIGTGGSWSLANKIIIRYGLIEETNFIPEDSLQEKSTRQKTALDKVNESLKNGLLSDPENRRDGKIIREVLDEAWELDEETKAMLDTVFGEDMSMSFYRFTDETGTPIIQAQNFKVEYSYGPNLNMVNNTQTLATAMNEWQEVSYRTTNNKKNAMRRALKALSANEPVLISWHVDFNALEEKNDEKIGSFNLETLNDAGEPGRQGGHLTVLEDFEAKVTLRTGPSELRTINETGSVKRNEWKVFGPYNLNGNVKINMTGSGDADLYVLNGSEPTQRIYDARPYKDGTNEKCSVNGYGKVFIGVHGYDDSSKFKLNITGQYRDMSLENSKRVTLKAGVTLDRSNIEDAVKLDAALEDDAEVVFLRVKNSWGGPQRTDLAYAPHVEKGYHDLYMDYLDNPITQCSEKDENGERDCSDTIIPLNDFVVPPGY